MSGGSASRKPLHSASASACHSGSNLAVILEGGIVVLFYILLVVAVLAFCGVVRTYAELSTTIEG